MTTLSQIYKFIESDVGRAKFTNPQTRYTVASIIHRVGDHDVDGLLANWKDAREAYWPACSDRTLDSYKSILVSCMNALNQAQTPAVQEGKTTVPATPKIIDEESTVRQVYSWAKNNRRKVRAKATDVLAGFAQKYRDLTWKKFNTDFPKIVASEDLAERTQASYVSRMKSVDRSVRGLPPARPSVPMTRKPGRKSSRDVNAAAKSATPRVRVKAEVTAPSNGLSLDFGRARKRIEVRERIEAALSGLPPEDAQTVLFDVLCKIEQRV